MQRMMKNKKILAAGAAAVIACIVLPALLYAGHSGNEEAKEYHYTETEQFLADAVKEYLHESADLSDTAAGEIADEAVKSYRLIVNSDIETVNDDHTEAIQSRILAKMDETDELADADTAGLSAGTAALVWQTILDQMETKTENTDPGIEYYRLTESLRTQINALEKRKMKVSIQANISSENLSGLSAEELLALINGMTDQELEELAAALGISYEDLKKLMDALNSDIDKELDSRLEALKKELSRELSKELEKELPSDGKNGKDGADGKSVTGKTGASGEKGSSVFIRYSESPDGKNMTTEPDQNTKYIGTYTGNAASARPSDYVWSQYRGNDGDSIFIRYSADSDGADMQEQPDNSTKYMGTYTGKAASDNPEDYTWTRYSDATISYSDGTLYIIQ